MCCDYLPGTTIKINQKENIFKINTDTHLLGKYIVIKQKDVVLDIGVNTGALLLYASTYKHKKLIGVDINNEALLIAKENLKLNNVDAELYNCKVQDLKIDNVDVIICNPPYFNNERYINDSLDIYQARHDDTLPLNELFKAYRSLLKDSGRIYMVYRSSRIIDVIRCSDYNNIKIRKLKYVYDARKDNAVSVLIELGKGRFSDIIVESPMVINNEKN